MPAPEVRSTAVHVEDSRSAQSLTRNASDEGTYDLPGTEEPCLQKKLRKEDVAAAYLGNMDSAPAAVTATYDIARLGEGSESFEEVSANARSSTLYL